MQPRLKSSKKWTAFPKEYADQIQGVFEENFKKHLTDKKLVIEGRIYPEEVVLRVGIQNKGELRQRNFEVSMDYSAKDKNALESIHTAVDVAASMLMDYFENDETVDFPLVWKEYPFNKKKVYLQTTSENSELEAAANKLLGVEDDSLVHEVEGEDEPETPADPNDDGSPRMFSGTKGKKKLH